MVKIESDRDDESSNEKYEDKVIIKSYRLKSLLAKCNLSQGLSDSEKELLADPAVGLEEI